MEIVFATHATPTLTQTALTYLIERGEFARHIRRVNKIYRERHEMLVRTIGREYLELMPSTTGLHVAALARRASAQQIAAVVGRAADSSVAIHGLAQFVVRETNRAGIVLGYGTISTRQIPEGLRRLRRCFDR